MVVVAFVLFGEGERGVVIEMSMGVVEGDGATDGCSRLFSHWPNVVVVVVWFYLAISQN